MKLCLVSAIVLICSSCLYSQQHKLLISKIEEQLTKGQVTVSSILSDTGYMTLHSNTAFREIIKKHANAGKLVMVSKYEPGKRITVKGEIKTKDGKAIAGALVYVYQTSDKGWYADTAAHVLQNEGDMRHARLFGYFKTGAEGRFEFETIQPKAYPDSDLPAHIHIAVWKNENIVHGIPGELLFDDDPRLTADRRKRSLAYGYLIEKNTGTLQHPLYYYSVVEKE
jgi:protocatechuate 3,4-dioxygenase beta subunit